MLTNPLSRNIPSHPEPARQHRSSHKTPPHFDQAPETRRRDIRQFLAVNMLSWQPTELEPGLECVEFSGSAIRPSSVSAGLRRAEDRRQHFHTIDGLVVSIDVPARERRLQHVTPAGLVGKVRA